MATINFLTGQIIDEYTGREDEFGQAQIDEWRAEDELNRQIKKNGGYTDEEMASGIKHEDDKD